MKKLLTINLMVVLLALALPVFSQSPLSVSTEGGALPIFSSEGKAYILTDADDSPVVATAARLLKEDVAQVTNNNGVIETANSVQSGQPYAVIIGTVGSSAYIDQLSANGKIDVSDITGKWETYKLMTVDNPLEGVEKALVVAGSNPRGTAYGTLEVSRMMGVHPWYWWADIEPETLQSIYVTEGELVGKEPSVKYRGLFINDEDWSLLPWASSTIDKADETIGPRTYERVMELLLRMKANLLWPAMHEVLKAKTFWYFDECHELAKQYGIVLGSSHADIMLRCNNSEWIHWKGYSKEDYNYATNKEKVQNYWAERAGESKDVDAIYTLGMRGVHDSGIVGYSTTADKVAGLTEIIAFQRQLISDSIASYRGTTVDQIPQTFIPYKEVLDAYNAGLQVPDDVILCWVDDNHGYIRQLSNVNEQKRKGGAGIYYHLSYYGSPHDYLWLSSISPSLISYELSKAYDLNTRSMWIINVGDIKPAEEELQFCMDLAWDVDAWRPESAYDYTEHWAKEIFGETLGKEIAEVRNEYYRLAASGKPEHISFNAFSESEQNQRMADYDALVERVKVLRDQMPERLKKAFYQLVRYPVTGAADMNKKVFCAAQSLSHAAAGYDDALTLASKASTAFNEITSLTLAYNKGSQNNDNTLNPKWRNFMSYNPRVEGNAHLNMPTVATAADVASVVDSLHEDASYIIPASAYASASASLKVIRGLGTSGEALSQVPVKEVKYSTSTAPKATYLVPVSKGKNIIEIRMLPTFPIYADYDLRVAYAIGNGAYKTESIKTTATSAQWNMNVLSGYTAVTTIYEASQDEEIELKVALLDPSLVLNDIKVTADSGTGEPDITGAETKTSLIKNPDFSLDGNSKQTGKVPTHWSYTGNKSYSSISVAAKGPNNEIPGNQPHWQVWSGSGVMSQTIANLPAGEYIIEANVVATGVSQSTLFANDDSRKLTTTAGRIRVATQVGEGGSLKLGINKAESGSDIEVDDFRLYYKPLSTGISSPYIDSQTGAKQMSDTYFYLDGRPYTSGAPAPRVLIKHSASGKVTRIMK